MQALLTCPTQAAAAERAGVGLTTLKRFLRDDEFLEAYQEAVGKLIAEAATSAKKGLDPALFCLREIIENRRENSQVRVSAARSLLEYGLRLTERVDILDRLDKLESELDGTGGHLYN